MSTLLYQLTVTDSKGMVLVEEVVTDPNLLAQKLPAIKNEAEDVLEEMARKRLEA